MFLFGGRLEFGDQVVSQPRGFGNSVTGGAIECPLDRIIQVDQMSHGNKNRFATFA